VPATRPAPATTAAVAALVAAAVAGALAARHPALALAGVGGAALAGLAFVAPVTGLAILLVLTGLLPYAVANRYGFGGGTAIPSLIASDVVLLGALLRAGLVVGDHPLPPAARRALLLVTAVACVGLVQVFHGMRQGANASAAGAELRVLLGYTTVVIAMPLLADPAARRRLERVLVAAGLLLGAWGLAQWVLRIPFSVAGDAGVRQGVRFAAAGRGQVQGGLFGFPVAVVVATAVLLAPGARAGARRLAVGAVLVLNAIALLLTYERTFWLATGAGLVLVALRAGAGRRATTLVAGAGALTAVVALMALTSPAEVTAARQRLFSIGTYGTDASLVYRQVESRRVAARISAHPLTGSGLGTAILWGPPFPGVHPALETYSHDGYLWLAWKLGVPASALLVLLLAVAVAGRGPPVAAGPEAALRVGAQGALLALLLAGVTFPAFSALSITATMGVLVALCVMPVAPGGTR
jgi:hypothetical protein